MFDDNAKPHARLLQATLDLLGMRGYRAVTAQAVAAHAKVSLDAFRKAFADDAVWLEAAYEYVLERRVADMQEAARTWAEAGAPDLDSRLKALLSTVIVRDEPNPNLAAAYDLHLKSRSFSGLEPHMRALKQQWEPRRAQAADSLFPKETTADVRALILVHLEAVGAGAVSNGPGQFELSSAGLPLLRRLMVRTA